MKLYNLTAHRQNPEEWRRFGFDVESEPRLKELPLDNWVEVYNYLSGVFSDIPAGSALLVGGAQVITDFIFLFAVERRYRLFTAVTERVRDENDRFVFRLKGVVETPLSVVFQLGLGGDKMTDYLRVGVMMRMREIYPEREV